MIYNKYDLFMKKSVVRESDVDYCVKNPDEAYDFAVNVMKMSEQAQEVFAIISLNSKGDVIGFSEITRGTLNSSLVHPREVFKVAFVQNAASIIAVHNHPSGDPSPSAEDIAVTERLKECGEILDVPLIDHIIVGDCYKYSFKENNYI